MRPPREIVLVGDDDDNLSVLRFSLSHSSPNSHHRCYAVTTALSVPDALDALRRGQVDLLLVQSPVEAEDALLESAKIIDPYLPRVVITKSEQMKLSPPVCEALLYRPMMWEILERLKILTQRKRGPRKKPVQGVNPLAAVEVVA